MLHWLAHGISIYFVHPTVGPGYSWWSGPGSDFGQATLITGLAAAYWQHTCHVARCPRPGRHVTASGVHVCRKHHPEIPSRGMTAAQVYADHHAALERGA